MVVCFAAQGVWAGERQLGLDDLCVGNGRVAPAQAGSLHIDSPQLRLVASRAGWQEGKIDFVYRGDSSEIKALGSGEVRRQIGLKLDAQDTCNVVYVMWQFWPRARISVSRKSNPGKYKNSDCLDGGYKAVTSDSGAPVESPAVGSTHSLKARADADRLIVEVDGAVSWEGTVPGLADAKGPVGIRSDNIKYDLLFFVSQGPKGMKEVLVDRSRNACLPEGGK